MVKVGGMFNLRNQADESFIYNSVNLANPKAFMNHVDHLILYCTPKSQKKALGKPLGLGALRGWGLQKTALISSNEGVLIKCSFSSSFMQGGRRLVISSWSSILLKENKL